MTLNVTALGNIRGECSLEDFEEEKQFLQQLREITASGRNPQIHTYIYFVILRLQDQNSCVEERAPQDFCPLMKRICASHGWKKKKQHLRANQCSCSCSPVTSRGPDITDTLTPTIWHKSNISERFGVIALVFLFPLKRKESRKQPCGAQSYIYENTPGSFISTYALKCNKITAAFCSPLLHEGV